jgi:hypothetical protein
MVIRNYSVTALNTPTTHYYHSYGAFLEVTHWNSTWAWLFKFLWADEDVYLGNNGTYCTNSDTTLANYNKILEEISSFI